MRKSRAPTPWAKPRIASRRSLGPLPDGAKWSNSSLRRSTANTVSVSVARSRGPKWFSRKKRATTASAGWSNLRVNRTSSVQASSRALGCIARYCRAMRVPMLANALGALGHQGQDVVAGDHLAVLVRDFHVPCDHALPHALLCACASRASHRSCGPTPAVLPRIAHDCGYACTPRRPMPRVVPTPARRRRRTRRARASSGCATSATSSAPSASRCATRASRRSCPRSCWRSRSATCPQRTCRTSSSRWTWASRGRGGLRVSRVGAAAVGGGARRARRVRRGWGRASKCAVAVCEAAHSPRPVPPPCACPQ